MPYERRKKYKPIRICIPGVLQKFHPNTEDLKERKKEIFIYLPFATYIVIEMTADTFYLHG
jgi:hypothetical protein